MRAWRASASGSTATADQSQSVAMRLFTFSSVVRTNVIQTRQEMVHFVRPRTPRFDLHLNAHDVPNLDLSHWEDGRWRDRSRGNLRGMIPAVVYRLGRFERWGCDWVVPGEIEGSGRAVIDLMKQRDADHNVSVACARKLTLSHDSMVNRSFLASRLVAMRIPTSSTVLHGNDLRS
jgi:hypothetical protein